MGHTQKRKALVTPDWLRDSVAQGCSLPCADYAALPDLLKEVEKGPSSKSESRFTSSHRSPRTRSQSPSRAGAASPPAFLLPPPVPPPAVELDYTARLCCSRASPLICVNQPLCATLDVLRRGRALESNERSALSYARAIAVSATLPSFHRLSSQLVCSTGYQRYIHTLRTQRVSLIRSSAFPRKITAKERGEVRKLPYIGTKVSKMVSCARLNLPPFLYSHQTDRRIPLLWTYPRSWYVFYSLSLTCDPNGTGNRKNETIGTLPSSVVIHHCPWHRAEHGANSV